jgi:hypothetical protein
MYDGFLMYVCGMVYIRILPHRTAIQAIENGKAGPPILGGGNKVASRPYRQSDCTTEENQGICRTSVIFQRGLCHDRSEGDWVIGGKPCAI